MPHFADDLGKKSAMLELDDPGTTDGERQRP
jgi:hypothetical protein